MACFDVHFILEQPVWFYYDMRFQSFFYPFREKKITCLFYQLSNNMANELKKKMIKYDYYLPNIRIHNEQMNYL